MCLIVRVGVLCGQGGAACGSINSGLVWRSCAYFYPSVEGFTSMSNSGFFIGFFFFFWGEGEWVSSHYCFKYISHQTPEMFSTDNLTLSYLITIRY